jgi:hypothetical protein
VLPHNAARLDDDTHDVAAQARAAWEAAVCWDPSGTDESQSNGSPKFERSGDIPERWAIPRLEGVSPQVSP